MIKLAIVIPPYKEKYFSKSLKSLAEQTNKNFNVYVGGSEIYNKMMEGH